jgi:mannose-6-phosphate isomerase-like protein (cupin superfamily)
MSEPGISFAKLDRDTSERFVPLRKPLGVSAFGINQLTLQPGQSMRVHVHEHQEEVYLVLAGELTVVVEGTERVLRPDELLRVAPPVKRQLLNAGTEPTTLIALGGTGDHQSRDALAWPDWESAATEPGRSPQEVPLPPDR